MKQTLKLYISGFTPIAKLAIKNLKVICLRPEVRDVYDMEIINLRTNPDMAEQLNILATPLLITSSTLSICRIIGDLSNHDRVIAILDLCEPYDNE